MHIFLWNLEPIHNIKFVIDIIYSCKLSLGRSTLCTTKPTWVVPQKPHNIFTYIYFLNSGAEKKPICIKSVYILMSFNIFEVAKLVLVFIIIDSYISVFFKNVIYQKYHTISKKAFPVAIYKMLYRYVIFLNLFWLSGVLGLFKLKF